MDPSSASYTPWQYSYADGPILATALHAGHAVRQNLLSRYALDEAGRLREEDPGTAVLAKAVDHHLIARASRFEMDLNRSRAKTVYLTPDDAWGLTVWKQSLPPEIVSQSLQTYDAFYRRVREILIEMERTYGRFLVLDFHSYNHRRGGPSADPAPQMGNPDIDVEINASGRAQWAPVVDTCVSLLQTCDHDGHPADVRESVRFQGGHFINWVQSQFPRTGCAIAIEFKKTYMDEWTGRVDTAILERWRDTIRQGLPALAAQLHRI